MSCDPHRHITWHAVEGGEDDEEEEEASQQLSDDYAIAEFIRDHLVPKAVLYFTGEIMDDEEDDVSTF